MDYKILLKMRNNNKLYYSISEVSNLAGVKPYVLRYWESEFKNLKPRKSMGGRRTYTSKDIDIILLIKKLLYENKYSIQGARNKFKEIKKGTEFPHKVGEDIIQEISNGLKEVLEILK